MTNVKILLWTKEYLSKNNLKFTEEALEKMKNKPVISEDNNAIGVIKEAVETDEGIMIDTWLYNIEIGTQWICNDDRSIIEFSAVSVGLGN